MSVKSKRGITVSSLVLYVVLFFAITTFLSIVYSNMNDTLFNNRGMALNYTMLNKLEYNLTDSALQSVDIVLADNTLTFSNGDKYYYDSAKKMVILNNGVLCTSVSKFEPTITTGTDTKKLTINLRFNKYMAELNKTIVSSVEVE